MLDPSEAASKGLALGSSCGSGEARLPPQRHPRPAVAIEPINLDLGIREELRERHVPTEIA